MPNAFAVECVFVLAQQGQWDITTVLVAPKSEMLLLPVRKQQHSVGARRSSTPSVFAQEKTGETPNNDACLTAQTLQY